MGYFTNKRASQLGVGSKKPDGADNWSDPGPRLIAPGETFNADGLDIPKAWQDLGWIVPASKEDEAAAKERDAQAAKPPAPEEPAPAPEPAVSKASTSDEPAHSRRPR